MIKAKRLDWDSEFFNLEVGELITDTSETFKIGDSVGTDDGPAGGRPQPQPSRGWVPGTPALMLVRPYRIFSFPRFRHPKKERTHQQNDRWLEPHIRCLVDP